MDIDIKKIFRSFDFRNNRIFNARTNTTPAHDEALVNKLYVDDSHIKQITQVDGVYTDILTKLAPYNRAGNIVFIDSLGIAVKYDGSIWTFFKGVYTVTDQTSYDTIPATLLKSNEMVLVGGSTLKTILSTLLLSDVVIVASSIPGSPENFRYYLINNFLYYSIDGTLYKLTTNIYVNPITTVVSNQTIVHNLKSSHVTAYLRIDTSENISIQPGVTFQLDYNYVDVDTITITFDISVEGTIIIFSN